MVFAVTDCNKTIVKLKNTCNHKFNFVYIGLTGVRGDKGALGVAGLPGFDGPQGEAGVPGLPGIQGISFHYVTTIKLDDKKDVTNLFL